MSVDCMSAVWKHSTHSGNKLLLLLALADHANDDGICWPSLDKLAEKARISKRQAQRIVSELTESGEISILKKGNGRGQSTLYHVNVDKISSIKDDNMSTFDSKKGDKSRTKGDTMSTFSDKNDDEKVDICDIKGDKSCIKGDIAMSTEPSIEPSIEPPQQSDSGCSSLDPDRKTDPDYAELCAAIEDNGFGFMTSILAEQVQTMMDEYPKQWILDAMKISVKQNKRKLTYADGILQNWRRNGRDDELKKTDKPSGWQAFDNQDLPDYMREMLQ